jgi:UPF0716 protein FxsA
VCGLLALLFIVIPAVEIYVLITVGGIIGALPTLGVIVATGFLGAALAKHQGVAALRTVQQSMMQGKEVGTSVAGAALVLVAAAFMVTPGFLTDITGFALLVPQLRMIAAKQLVERIKGRVKMHTIGPEHFGAPFDMGDDDRDDDDYDPPAPGVIDV